MHSGYVFKENRHIIHLDYTIFELVVYGASDAP